MVVQGALWLAAAGLLAKVFSAAQRVLVARLLGAEGVGLYEMAAPVLAAALSLATMGLPLGLTALVGAAFGRGDEAGARAYRRTARWALALSGLAAGASLWFGAARIAGLLGDPRVAPAIRAVAPAVVLATVLQGERAWLQGCGRMAGSAASLAVEQLARAAAAVAAGLATLGSGAENAATAVSFCSTAGAAAGLAACRSPGGAAGADGADGGRPPARRSGRSRGDCRTPRRRGRAGPASGGHGGAVPAREAATRGRAPSPRPSPRPSAGAPSGGRFGPARRLFALGGPNWLAGALVATSQTVDAGFVQWRLRAAGFDHDRATALYGELHGMAVALATSPAVLFGAIASAVLPVTAAAWARGDAAAFRARATEAYRWAALVSLPCATGLWLLARPICALLFDDAAAGGPLSVVAWSAVPLGFSQVAGALSNAAGRPAVLLPGVFAGVAARLALTALLTGRAGLGIQGAAFSLLAGWTVSACGNVGAVERLTGATFSWLDVLARPLLGCLAMTGAALLAYPWLQGHGVAFAPALLATIALAGAVYVPVALSRPGW